MLAGIAEAAERAGRRPEDITLVAVTKGVPAERIREGIALGLRNFGENRVQEAEVKYKEFPEEVCWHFIGRLQGNKVRRLVPFVGVIHSLDRVELAEEIQRRATRPVEVLIEVNTTGEQTKGGVPPSELPRLVEATAGLERVRLTGLMTIAHPIVESSDEARVSFRRLARLREEMRRRFPEVGLGHLSMGMSQDYVVAVEEGATMVRVGEAIFGAAGQARAVTKRGGRSEG